MLLLTFSLLFFLGFAVWIVGHQFRYTGVAAIGAAFIIIAGSAVALTGLEARTGETRVVDNNTTTVTYAYETVSVVDVLNASILGELGLGGLVMALGGVLFGQTLSQDI